MNSWPDGAMTPFRSEKNTNWEGAFHVPGMIRWPGHIEARTVSNEIISHLDWLPTLLSAAGEPDITQKLFDGHEADGKTFRVHLDGYDQLPYLTGEAERGPRTEFFYFSDDGDLVAMRYDNWKLVFMEQRMRGTVGVWLEPPSWSCARPSSSTCAPIPSSAPTRRPTRTGTGSSTGSSSSFPRR